MLSKLRKRLTWANVAMTLALVFAMTGGAYAAKKYLITSTKQISPSVLKALQGKAGAAGAQGPQGPAGPGGPAGPAGPAGKGEKGERGEQGPEGKAGTNGTNGTSVTSKAFAGSKTAGGQTCKEGGSEFTAVSGVTLACNGEAGQEGTSVTNTALSKGNANCAEGGSEFKVGTGAATYACNGKEGKEGSPWTVGGTLPSKQSEKGTWTVGAVASPVLTTSISFSIPLANRLLKTKSEVHFIEGEGTGGGCPVGSKASEPEAEPGNLCVFLDPGFKVNFSSASIVSGETGEIEEAGKVGAWLLVNAETAEKLVVANGTWAVTAE